MKHWRRRPRQSCRPTVTPLARENNYAYVAAVSEDDAKKGVAVGEVMMFAFRGKHDGVYKVSAVDEIGQSTADYECSNPCAVIKRKTY